MTVATAFALCACAALPGERRRAPESPYISAERARDWSGADIRAFERVFAAALDAAPGEAEAWAGGARRGAVSAGAPRLVFSADAPEGVPAPAGLRVPGPMELDLGPHVLTANSNVRLGPSTDDPVLATYDAGSRVDVAGRLVGAPWALVVQGGRVRGYIHTSLLRRPDGASARLAGARLATPGYCRPVTITAEGAGGREEWSETACRSGASWRLAK